ncbi:MAG: asparaginase domain-containing protein [Sulfolobales archaeon]|nr:asparaginase domain-containing protein [Sulfolobales archaeon]
MKIDSSLMTLERWVTIARAIHDNYDRLKMFV